MTVQVTNLLAGPATGLWVADFGTAEPTTLDDEPGTGWAALGGTTGGVRLVADREFFALEVDQILMRAESVPTSENFAVQTSLAEATLENYARTSNRAEDSVVVGAGSKSYEPDVASPGTRPLYRALIVDGRAPEGFPRRVIVRKVLSTASVEAAMEKAGQTVFPVTWTGHYVSPSIKPFRLIDGVAVTP